MATTIPSQCCSVTNNSGKDIVIALALTPDETASGHALISAGKILEILTTDAGDTIIKNGSTAAVTLDRSYTPASGASGAVTAYDLLVCDSLWLCPLACLEVLQDSSTATFAPQTITPDSLTAMTQAILFYQTIEACPDAQLTKDYMEALHQTKDAVAQALAQDPDDRQAAGEAIRETLNSFFSSTKEYGQVSVAALASIDAYYRSFPAVWAQYKSNKTYYLYSSTTGANVFVGALSLKKSGAFDWQKGYGGYTCLFVPATNADPAKGTGTDASRAVTLTYQDGMFTDPTGATKTGLTGSFYLRRYLDGAPDSNQVVIVVTGQANGTPCLGYDQPLLGQTDDPQSTANGQPLSGVQSTGSTGDGSSIQADWKEIAMLVGIVVGGFLTLAGAAYLIYRIQRAIRYRSLKNLLADWEGMSNAQQQELANKFRDLDVDISDEIGYDFVKQQAERMSLLWQRERLGRALYTQREALKELLTYSTDDDIQQLLLDVHKSQRRLFDKANYNDLKDIVPDEISKFPGVQDKIKAIRDRLYQENTAFNPRTADLYRINGGKIFEDLQKSVKQDAKEENEIDLEIDEWVVIE